MPHQVYTQVTLTAMLPCIAQAIGLRLQHRLHCMHAHANEQCSPIPLSSTINGCYCLDMSQQLLAHV